jgi:hypothetical protein
MGVAAGKPPLPCHLECVLITDRQAPVENAPEFPRALSVGSTDSLYRAGRVHGSTEASDGARCPREKGEGLAQTA